ncbi:MAG: ABC transporter substrate-binding protein [Agarilytica sp.]
MTTHNTNFRKVAGIVSRALIVVSLLAGSIFAVAADAGKEAGSEKKVAVANISPHDVVEKVTSELMTVVSGGQEALKTNPGQYFKDVRAIMESSVDFKYIARNVMGAKYWKAASESQKTQFIEVFTSGMVETYAKGMANFADYEISVQKPAEAVGEKRKVEVIQKFKGPEGVNRVSYTMGKHRSGHWKLINVVLDGVNLGKTLRAQFSQSVTESKGDLDAAIAGWAWDS